MRAAMEGLPQWLSLLIAAISGATFGIGACLRWMWGISDRVLHLEAKVGENSVKESLLRDRHDHVYPMIQERIILPLDILEQRTNQHDSSLAVLMDRDRLETKFNQMLREMREHK